MNWTKTWAALYVLALIDFGLWALIGLTIQPQLGLIQATIAAGCALVCRWRWGVLRTR